MTLRVEESTEVARRATPSLNLADLIPRLWTESLHQWVPEELKRISETLACAAASPELLPDRRYALRDAVPGYRIFTSHSPSAYTLFAASPDVKAKQGKDKRFWKGVFKTKHQARAVCCLTLANSKAAEREYGFFERKLPGMPKFITRIPYITSTLYNFMPSSLTLVSHEIV